MGTVFAGTRLFDGLHVAIKVMHPRCAVSPSEVERFDREASVLEELHHLNIPTLYDVGDTEHGLPAMVIDLYAGSPLKAILDQRKTLAAPNVAGIGVQVCDALEHVHSYGIVHRDLKPGNLFVARQPDGRAVIKLVDFGLSIRPQATESRLTQAGCVAATPQYAAPAQVLRTGLSPRTDVYAVGVMLYRALTGVAPFAEADARTTLMAHVQKPVPIPNWEHYRVSEDQGEIVLWGAWRRCRTTALTQPGSWPWSCGPSPRVEAGDRSSISASASVTARHSFSGVNGFLGVVQLGSVSAVRRLTLILPAAVGFPAGDHVDQMDRPRRRLKTPQPRHPGQRCRAHIRSVQQAPLALGRLTSQRRHEEKRASHRV
ncbi:MAG: serine/threonine protein kinase [Myxococcota bacterium]|jgi:serine/threonine protein kinase